VFELIVCFIISHFSAALRTCTHKVHITARFM